MKKQVKSFGEFTRRKVNEDYYYDYKSQDFESGGKFHREEEFEIGDQVYVAGMEDIPGRVVGFDEDEYGSPLVVVRIAGTEKGYRESDVYKLGDKDLGSWSLSRPRLTEDHFFPEPYGEESEFEIGDQVYVVGMGDFPGEVVGFDTDKNGEELIIVSMLGNEDLYTRDKVSTEPFQSNVMESVFDGTWRQREGYDQDEWFKKMKEYQEWLKELLGHHPYGPKLKIKSEYRLTDREKKLSTIVYFDSLSDSEEEELVEKAKEINEYRKIGHDPQWQMVIYDYLKELENEMFGYRMGEFERRYIQDKLDGFFELTQANGGSPYQLKKGMLDSKRTPILGR